MFEITGLDKLQKQLTDLSRRAEELDGTHSVTFAELFPDSFMQLNTRFSTMQEMLDASGIDNPEEIQDDSWNRFVAEHSSFSGWEDMKSTAGGEWAKKQLGF